MNATHCFLNLRMSDSLLQFQEILLFDISMSWMNLYLTWTERSCLFTTTLLLVWSMFMTFLSFDVERISSPFGIKRAQILTYQCCLEKTQLGRIIWTVQFREKERWKNNKRLMMWWWWWWWLWWEILTLWQELQQIKEFNPTSGSASCSSCVLTIFKFHLSSL